MLISGLGEAAVPQTLTFSARIADAGRPVTGPQSFTFTFWDVATGGTPGTNALWTETAALEVADGVVSAIFGAVSTNPLPATMFDGRSLFLEVTMGGTTFAPRMSIHSVPYAIRAGVAENVQCVDECVQDGEIAGVSGSKVSGTVANATTAGSVAWGNVSGKPAGFADNVDNVGTLSCTTYTASVSLAANGGAGQVTAPCSTGTVVGGGFWAHGQYVTNVAISRPWGNGWNVWGKNPATAATDLVAYAVCCTIQ
jgi:hypothetical protein